MIFYIATDRQGFRILKGTQAEARAISKDFAQIDIPTDKAGLMAALQELLTLTDAALLNQNVASDEAPTTIVEAAPVKTPEPVILPPTVQTVSEWLQDTATQREIEAVYTSIGCRIGELLRSSRAGESL